MATAFEFATAPRIVFAPGSLDRLGEIAAGFGSRAWLVSGRSALERAGVIQRAEELLGARNVSVARCRIEGEPDTHVVDQGCRGALEAGCDLVVGIGGGSVLDAAKAVACLMANGGEALDYLEVVGRGRRIERPSVPLIAVPTTAGTGSEVTRNAVLADPSSGTKASIRHESLMPRVALLDPTLTHSVPPDVTARTGLDALIQLIEPYVSRRANPMIDVLALEGIRRAAPALRRVHANPGDTEGRADMMLAALWSGMALAHCGLGASHALAGPLGGSYPIPHGTACAATMPWVMEANLRRAERNAESLETVRRYADVARAMGVNAGSSDAAAARGGVEAMHSLCNDLKIPALRSFGVTSDAIADLVARARRTSSMKANPVDLSEQDLAEILKRAIG